MEVIDSEIDSNELNYISDINMFTPVASVDALSTSNINLSSTISTNDTMFNNQYAIKKIMQIEHGL